jgi:hypothetical protein
MVFVAVAGVLAFVAAVTALIVYAARRIDWTERAPTDRAKRVGYMSYVVGLASGRYTRRG